MFNKSNEILATVPAGHDDDLSSTQDQTQKVPLLLNDSHPDMELSSEEDIEKDEPAQKDRESYNIKSKNFAGLMSTYM